MKQPRMIFVIIQFIPILFGFSSALANIVWTQSTNPNGNISISESNPMVAYAYKFSIGACKVLCVNGPGV